MNNQIKQSKLLEPADSITNEKSSCPILRKIK